MKKTMSSKEANWYNELLTIIQKSAKNKNSLESLFEDLFTPAERLHLAKRWQVVKQLNDDIPQREVSANLKVGLTTVTRGARELADTNGAFYKILNK